MKVKKGELPKSNSAISGAKSAAIDRAKSLINFSFKYLQEDHGDFQFSPLEGGYFVELLVRMKGLCSWARVEFLTNRSSTLRAHPIDWSDTSQNGFGIPGEEQIVDTPYQFSLSSNENGRVHGFFIDNTFYIVWFDKNHLLYTKR